MVTGYSIFPEPFEKLMRNETFGENPSTIHINVPHGHVDVW